MRGGLTLVTMLLLGAAAASLLPSIGVPDGLAPGSSGVSYAEEGASVTGSANLVTAVVVVYRGLDTLGEVVVLFCATAAVVMALGMLPRRGAVSKASPVVSLTARVMQAPLLLFGIYIAAHGHLGPGGGFPGGAVVASAFLLAMLGGTGVPRSSRRLPALESLAGLTFGLLGFWGMASMGSFLSNLVLPAGTPGALVSAGTVPLVSLAIGLKVASELSAVFASYRGGRP